MWRWSSVSITRTWSGWRCCWSVTVPVLKAPRTFLLGVIYRRYLGATSEVSGPMSDPLTLIADATGSHLILNGGICNQECTNEFNGWLRAGRLVPLLPTGFAHREAAEAW
jgi:hypothetical protein